MPVAPKDLDALINKENAERDLQQVKFEQPPEEPVLPEVIPSEPVGPSDVIAVGESLRKVRQKLSRLLVRKLLSDAPHQRKRLHLRLTLASLKNTLRG